MMKRIGSNGLSVLGCLVSEMFPPKLPYLNHEQVARLEQENSLDPYRPLDHVLENYNHGVVIEQEVQ